MVSLALGPLLLVALAACGGREAEEPEPPEPSSGVPPTPAPPVSAAPPPGLSPLPSQQQVVNAVPLGRRDPFARLRIALPTPPAPQPAASAPSSPPGAVLQPPAPPPGPPVPPEDFLFSGVIQAAGASEAIVQYGDLSGSLRAGDRGGATTELLPPGWSVASVDVQRGRLILRNRGQRIIVDL